MVAVYRDYIARCSKAPAPIINGVALMGLAQTVNDGAEIQKCRLQLDYRVNRITMAA